MGDWVPKMNSIKRARSGALVGASLPRVVTAGHMSRVCRITAIFSVVVSLLSTSALADVTSMADETIEAQCRAYFKKTVCSEALGRWLPRLPVFAATEPRRTPTRLFDGFGRTPGRLSKSFNAYAPSATAAVYGEAGPSRANIVYDRTSRIVFYGGGCCSYFKLVLASHVVPPPLAVASRNLTAVSTNSRIRLGESPASVMRIYGPARLQRLPMRPQMSFIFYENSAPPKPGSCVQRQTFGFTQGRLSYIEIYDGC